jgi:hypothetical protein
MIVAVALVGVCSAAPAGAATKDPCKVVTTGEISKAFDGAAVERGVAGLKTAASAQCNYAIAATSTLPAGDLVVIVMYAPGGKAAYDGLKTNPLSSPTTGLTNSIYNSKQSVVNTLEGKSLLGMQGLFSDGTLPVAFRDVQSQLVAISKVGLKRI